MSKNRMSILGLKSHYTKVPNQVFEVVEILSKSERRIYWDAIAVYLCFIYSADNFHPGVRYIAKKLGKSKSSVEASLKLLVSLGILTKQSYRSGTRDIYTFVYPGRWSVWNRAGSDSTIVDGDMCARSLPSCEKGHNYKEEEMTKAQTIFSQPQEENLWLSKMLDSLPTLKPNPHVPCPTHVFESGADLMAELGIEG